MQNNHEKSDKKTEIPESDVSRQSFSYEAVDRYVIAIAQKYEKSAFSARNITESMVDNKILLGLYLATTLFIVIAVAIIIYIIL